MKHEQQQPQARPTTRAQLRARESAIVELSALSKNEEPHGGSEGDCDSDCDIVELTAEDALQQQLYEALELSSSDDGATTKCSNAAAGGSRSSKRSSGSGSVTGGGSGGAKRRAGLCEHGRKRYYCKPCGGAGICAHSRRRAACKQCGGTSVCVHARDRYHCR
eukprot:TRINITY_DN3219_c0_g2_i2.p2 TRINITY_DN3219_c0_g2~~TRINITY_DN3219_c0_g2_i2.p2  ORF type:complete len:163 (-),score=56.05 TRINITY_DN3219_c0_g2_i2:937-1425(-)